MPGIIVKVDKSKSMGAAILEWASLNLDREPTAYDRAMRKIKGLDPVTDEDRAYSQKVLREERERKLRQ